MGFAGLKAAFDVARADGCSATEALELVKLMFGGDA